MTETTETTLLAKLRLNRGLTIKLVSVGLFAALGTFAVVQSILGEKNASNSAEQEAVAATVGPADALQGLLTPPEKLGDNSQSEKPSSESAIPAALIKTSVAAGDSPLPVVTPATSGGPSLPELNLVGAERKAAVPAAESPTSTAKPIVPELSNSSRSTPVALTADRPAPKSPDKPESKTEFRLSSEAEQPSPVTPAAAEKQGAATALTDARPSKPLATPPEFSGTPNRESNGQAATSNAGGGSVGNALGDRQAAGASPASSSPPGPAGGSPPANSLRTPNVTSAAGADASEPNGLASPANGLGTPPTSPSANVGPASFSAAGGNSVNATTPNSSVPNPAASSVTTPSAGFSSSTPSLPPPFGGAGAGQETGGRVPGFASSPETAPKPVNPLAVPGSGGTPSSSVGGTGLPANLPTNFNQTPPGLPTASGPAANPGLAAGGMVSPSGGLPAASFSPPSLGGQPTPYGGAPGPLPGQGVPSQEPKAESGFSAAPVGQRPTAGPPSLPPNSSGLGMNPNLARNSAATAGVAAAPGAGTPGRPELEGEQIPALSIEKVAPREIQIDQPTEFRIVVKNVGRVIANEVRVTDQVPRGAEFIKAVPEATRGSGGGLMWELGSLKPGEERTVVLTLQPKQTGEIGSVAQVTFATPASMRVLVTKPQLAVEHSGPAKVMIGDRVPLTIQVRNLGNGPARDVILQEAVPAQLKFAEDFQDLEYEIGTLAPGESRKVTLNLSAAQIGRFRNTILVSGAGGLHAEHQLDMEVVAPQLQLSSEGPNRRYLKRNATHVFSVRNSGTAIATNLDLVTKLPRGVRFVTANNQGQYDPGSHAVYWSLDRLNVGQAASVQLTTTPEEPGEQELEFVATADLNQKASFRQPLLVEDLVELFFEIDDVEDVIEVGSETRYRLRLINQGTVTATNLQLVFSAEQGIRPVSVDNRLAAEVRGQEVIFAPVAQIRPGEEVVTLITAVGAAPGEHRVVARLRADQREMNVSKEESTRVYADR